MRLQSYARGARPSQRLFIAVTRLSGAEVDDVGKVCMRRPEFFGRPFLKLAQCLLRGRSFWSVAERELFAAVVSDANSCTFCVGTHGEIARILGREGATEWRDGRFGVRATAAATFLDHLTRDPRSVTAADVATATAAGLDGAALTEAIYIAFCFNTINRVADALGFSYRDDHHRRRGAAVLRRTGYRLPPFLVR
jgi:uncharacterized peroxidase-related enzyme